MKKKLSIVIITQNSSSVLIPALESVGDIADEIIVVDSESIDNIRQIAEKYGARVFVRKSEDLGGQKQCGIDKAKNEWILILDADERVTPELSKEIKELLSKDPPCDAYRIPFKNHLFNKSLHYGGENYAMVRLFKKSKGHFKSALVHESLTIKGKIGRLKNHIEHYSYRSLGQIFNKFTDYAIREARQKYQKKENLTWQKIFLYGPHMFYARFIRDYGYKDGLFRLPLDIGFAYMEFLTYFFILLYHLNIFKEKRK